MWQITQQTVTFQITIYIQCVNTFSCVVVMRELRRIGK